MICLVLPALLAAGQGLAQSGIPDLSHCQAWLQYDGADTPTLMVRPDGQGSAFTEAQLPDGTEVDARVFLRVLDWNDEPVEMFPREDLWLESRDGGLVYCPGGTIADESTDADGLTWWSRPLAAGGFSQALLAVLVNGDDVWVEGLRLSFNSPDINGDLAMNLPDVTLFAMDYFNGYRFRSDLYRDGVLDVRDLGRLAAAAGVECP
jgi:hypothetical protein